MDAPASPTNGKSGECETTQIFQDRISLLTVNPSYFTERHNYLLCGNFLDIYSVWSKFEKFSVYLACIERYEETFGIFVDDVLTFSGYHKLLCIYFDRSKVLLQGVWAAKIPI